MCGYLTTLWLRLYLSPALSPHPSSPVTRVAVHSKAVTVGDGSLFAAAPIVFGPGFVIKFEVLPCSRADWFTLTEC